MLSAELALYVTKTEGLQLRLAMLLSLSQVNPTKSRTMAPWTLSST